MSFIDSAIDMLDEWQQRAGYKALQPPGDTTGLAAIEEAIAPLRLPESLRTFWERVDPHSVIGLMWRAPVDLSFVLEAWQDHVESQFTPPLLMPFGYNSHCFFFVELESDFGPGGSVWTGAYAGQDFIREFDDLSGCITAWTLSDPNEMVMEESWDERVQQQWAVAPEHPTYGHERRFSDLPEQWPAIWKASAGYHAEAEEPKGRTHTIAQIIDARRSGPVEATIVCRVGRTIGSSAGSWQLVSDETGSIDVFVPAGVHSFSKPSRRVEFDVVCEPSEPNTFDMSHLDSAQNEALSGNLEAAQQAAHDGLKQFFGERAPSATAIAMRFVNELG